MREIRLVDTSEMKFIKEGLVTKPIWVFVGSSISFFAPSSIPNGGKISHTLGLRLLENNTTFLREEHYKKSKELFGQVLFEHLFELAPDITKIKYILNDFFKKPASNELHELLINALGSGLISGIITTNYDLCFEKTSDFSNNNIKMIVNEAEALNYKDGDKIIFKIHGTCNECGGEDLHCTLRDEGSMPEWKVTFLRKILNQVNMIFTGYSGFDFEICQEIQELDNLEMLVWNDIKPFKELSNNAKGIIDKFDGYVLVGDMVELIYFLSNRPYKTLVYDEIEIESNMDDLVNSLSGALSQNEVFTWFINAMTSCGFVRASIYSLKKAHSKFPQTKIPIAFYRELLGASMYKMGLYRYALKHYLISAYHFRKKKFDYIRLLIDATEACKAGFRVISSLLLLRYCRISIQKCKEAINVDEMQFLSDRYCNRKNEIGARILNLKLGRITKFILKFIDYSSIERIQVSSAKRGDWVLNFNDRVTNARGKVSSNEYKEISEKMNRMGLKFEYFYDFRRFLEKKCAEVGNEIIITEYMKTIEDMIIDEKSLGIFPEVWKLMRFCKDMIPSSANGWQKYFWKCQYSIYGRVLLLLKRIHV